MYTSHTVMEKLLSRVETLQDFVSITVDCDQYAQNWALFPEDTSHKHHEHEGRNSL